MPDDDTALKALQDASASDLAAGVLGHLFDLLTSGDDELFEERRHFFAWVSPGLPFLAQEWDFMESLVGGTPEDSARRSHAAWAFAQMVDFVPDTSGLASGSTLFEARAGSLSGEYERALREAEVVKQPPDPELQAKIDEIREALWVTEELEVGGVSQTSVKPTFILEEYQQTRQAYEDALREERSAQSLAQAAVSQEAVANWRNLGGLLRERRISALQTWESRGRRDFVENLMAEMARLEGEQMAAVVERLQAMIDPAALPTDQQSGAPFFYAQVLPSTAIQAEWQRHRFTHSEYHHQSEKKSTSGGGFASVPALPGFVSGKGEWNEMEAEWDWTDFELSFELIELPIERPWFDEAFLLNSRWRLPEGATPVSTGGEDPEGTMPAIPERVVLAKNVTLRFADSHRAIEKADSEFGGKAGLGLGPFYLGGRFNRGEESLETEKRTSGQEIVSPETQIVGYRCRLLPTVPDPDPSIPEEHWIGPGKIGGDGDDDEA